MSFTQSARSAAFAARNRALRVAARFRPQPPLPDPLPDRIHYACGRNLLRGWLNVDGVAASFPGSGRDAKRVYPVELSGPQPFRTAAFQYAFAEDFIEHLPQADALTFLTECYRVLSPGGVLRLSFPGLEGVLAKHYTRPDVDIALEAKRDAYDAWGHHHFFSLASITTVAMHLGYTDVQEVEFGRSHHEALSGLETRSDQIGLNLNVEITR